MFEFLVRGDNVFEQTKALCKKFLDMGIPSFDLIVYKDGECILRHMGGYADKDKKIPICGKEKYHIYSCSKLITCVAAMQLWEKGMFSLEDDIAEYIPAFRELVVKTESGVRKAKNSIKILDLFRMTSGLNYNMSYPELVEYMNIPNNHCPTVEVADILAKSPLEFEPGEGWVYGLNHDVLGALVEILSGEKFEDYVKNHIFDPLGMENSSFLHPLEDWNGFAQQYQYNSETNQFIPYWGKKAYFGKEHASGGGGCVSTVDDYIKFLEALRIGDVILKKETIELMATDKLEDKHREGYHSKKYPMGYGLGMRTPRSDPKRTEFGWGGAAGAYASVDPVNNMTIFYVQHVLASPNASMREWIYRAVRGDLLGEKVDIPGIDEEYNANITY